MFLMRYSSFANWCLGSLKLAEIVWSQGINLWMCKCKCIASAWIFAEVSSAIHLLWIDWFYLWRHVVLCDDLFWVDDQSRCVLCEHVSRPASLSECSFYTNIQLFSCLGATKLYWHHLGCFERKIFWPSRQKVWPSRVDEAIPKYFELGLLLNTLHRS